MMLLPIFTLLRVNLGNIDEGNAFFILVFYSN